MNANELRIGNLVIYGGSVVKMNLHEFTHFLRFPETYTPIILTEEILLKCGFEFSHITGDERGFSNKKINLLINAYDNNIIKFNVFIIKHLHQLQNLYFALAGTELEIEL